MTRSSPISLLRNSSPHHRSHFPPIYAKHSWFLNPTRWIYRNLYLTRCTHLWWIIVPNSMGILIMGWKCVSLWNGGVFIPVAKIIFFSHAVVSSRYYAKTTSVNWPPEVKDYNVRFTKILNAIKKRHDPTVTTVAQGVLEWKRSQNARSIGLDIQAWLDRFYMSRIGIRFLIGQRESLILPLFIEFHYYYYI